MCEEELWRTKQCLPLCLVVFEYSIQLQVPLECTIYYYYWGEGAVYCYSSL